MTLHLARASGDIWNGVGALWSAHQLFRNCNDALTKS